jgi:transposase InsO family protein
LRFAFIEEHERQWALSDLCRVLSVSRSGFHAWRIRGKSMREHQDEQLAVEVVAVHERSRKTYGSPRVHAELRARGVRTGRKRVARLMRAKSLVARCKRRFRRTTDSRHSNPIAPNIVARCFRADAPNQIWVTDVTAIWTLEGWTYLAVMLDLFSRRVVAWAMSESNDTALALDVLREAVRLRRPPHGLIHHSDRGSPYASSDYRAELARHGSVASMSRRGDCWDNAVAESFFATLRAELVDHQAYASPTVAAASISDYIDGFYNISRRHSYLGYLNPVEHELRCHAALEAP